MHGHAKTAATNQRDTDSLGHGRVALQNADQPPLGSDTVWCRLVGVAAVAVTRHFWRPGRDGGSSRMAAGTAPFPVPVRTVRPRRHER